MEITIETERLMYCVGLILGEYVLVLLAVVADLISGVRKAKMRGEARRSKAFRATVDKIARYYNALFALTVIDSMQLAGVEYLRLTVAWGLPLIPVFTLLGAIGVALIEIKSIYEKADEKERMECDEAMRIMSRYLRKTGIAETGMKAVCDAVAAKEVCGSTVT